MLIYGSIFMQMFEVFKSYANFDFLCLRIFVGKMGWGEYCIRKHSMEMYKEGY